MHLSAKQFAEIVEKMEADLSDPTFPGNDKRRATRVALKNRATIIPYVDGAPVDGVGVEVRDFSPRGIRFLHSERLTSGSQFVLELPQAGDPVQILCTVMHSRATGEGPISMGAEFTCVLHKGKAPPAPSAAERRSERDRIRHSILD